MAVGGTKAQNAGLLAAWMSAMPALMAEPPSQDQRPSGDLVAGIEQAGTLFPPWLGRLLRKQGLDHTLAQALAAERADPNRHTRRAAEDTIALIAEEVMRGPLTVYRLAAMDLARVLTAIEAEERGLFRKRVREIEPHQRPAITGEVDAVRACAQRALDTIRDMEEVELDAHVASRLRTAFEGQLGVIT
jgi:hypothetical protein